MTVSIGKKTARTDAKGRFLLPGVDPEATTLTVDGRTANSGKRDYGTFDIRVHPKRGRTVDLGFPVWMTPLDTEHTVTFDAPAKKDVVLTTPKIPGLEVHIPKGSVVRDEHGEVVTELGITAIPLDRPPFPLPDNSVVPVYFTVQPGGTHVFPEGARIVYPNYTGEAPGTRVEFLDYDPEDKGWHVYGHGTVSADGRQVVPDAKTRVWAFHGAMFNISDLVPWDLPSLPDVFDWLSGDPVDLGTGLLTDSRTDLAVADPLGSAELTRTYWQGDTRSRAFGIGRDLTYNAFLHSEKQYQEVDLYLPGGAKVHFIRTSPGTSFTDAVFEPLDTPTRFRGSKILNNSGKWELRFRDGSVWVFPQYAPLKEVRDRHGNTVELTRLSGNKGEVTRITTPGGRWISLVYDTNHRVREARDNTGRTTSYTYDSAGRLKTVIDPAGGTLAYTYDGTSNRIATATDARGITYLSNTYDTKGRVKKQTLTEGATYDFAYTEGTDGRITATEVTQPGGAVRKVTFDAHGYGVSDTAAHGTDLARKTILERGPNHRIDAIIDPYGRRTELAYDTNGNVTSATELAGTEAARTTGTVVRDGPYDQPTRYTDALGETTVLTYDGNGDLATVTDPEGRITSYSHTTTGRLSAVTDPAGAATEYTYRNGELVSVTDAEGRTTRQFTDAAGRPTALTDPAGAVTTIAYDELNQTTHTNDPLGHTTAFGYDAGGNLTRLTDARGNTTAWEYDDADRPEAATDPLGARSSFSYDPVGHLAGVTGRDGRKATAAYDLLGRSKSAEYGVDEFGRAESTVTYTYDDADLLARLSDTEAGTQTFSYDAYDRLRSTTGPTGTVSYDYDNADRRSQMLAAGTTTTYGYDDSGILTSLTTGTHTVTFALDAAGRERTATLPGGWTRTTDVDDTGTVTGLTYAHDGTTVGDLVYGRDSRGLQTGLTGSLAKVTLPAPEAGAVFDDANRLTALGGRSFTYDADGRLKSDELRDYTWNARGRLTSLTGTGDSNDLSASFGYDPLGGRTERTVDGSTTKFLTDGTNPLAELDATGTPAATVTTSGLDQFLTRTENGTTQLYLTDALGTVVGLADADGTIATTYAYDPYGQPTASGEPSTNRHTFTGREDDGTGLLYYRNRYYDPQTGRFLSEDPIGHAGGPNLYQYALSSPTTYTDPTGNSPVIAGCVAGGLFEGGMDWLGQRLSGRKVDWGSVATSAATGCAFGMLGVRVGAKQCLRNSFTADTPVLMADGTRKRIEDVEVGDEVLAIDPETGESGPRKVTALIEGTGEKHLIDLTVDTDGPAGTATGELTATDGHPFWVPSLHRWVDAADLRPGQWLRTSSGTWVQITGVSARTQRTTVHNLTVDDLHTYYVFAGNAPVLAHNCGSTPPGVPCVCRPGTGAGPADAPIRHAGPWTRGDIGRGAHGLRPRHLGDRIEIHHADQMPGSPIHELDQLVHRGVGTDLHRNPWNQGVTPEMRAEDTQLHWWYRSQEQGWGHYGPDLWYDNWPGTG
ncbi:RHS repeat-associated core domain-containing protein [Streptomyces sp. URMC 125]|uniref:RHS repeat-associated core domain-containing protein n=1 Tax=Streptomyces sp. URMC 125 TaxID=3423419 RepID=UPI003F1D4F39